MIAYGAVNQLIEEKVLGRAYHAWVSPDYYSDPGAMIDLADELMKRGHVVILNFDGQRNQDKYTAMVSSAPGESVRIDSDDLPSALAYATLKAYKLLEIQDA